MATYVNNLRLKEIATGDESGTWGTSTNTNLELIGEALGFQTEASFSSDADVTTTVADGASDPARALYFKVTSGVSLTATRTLTIGPNTVSRVMFIENATSGSQSINISQGSGANVTIANGKTELLYLDGAGSGAAVVLTSPEVAVTQLTDVTSSAAEINVLDGATADTVVNSKAVIYGSAGQITASEIDVDNIQLDGNVVKVTNTNGNLQLFPNGTGFTELYGNTNAGAIRFNCEANSHGITIKGAPHSAGATYSLELPNSLGSSGQVLSLSDGAGKLAFTTIAATTLGDLGITATASELNLNDGSSAGTIANSKTVVYGSSGEVNATTLQVSGTAITSTPAEINLLDALSRGSILYGNSSGATAILTKGAADTVLTSDGTDISWQAAGGGVDVQEFTSSGTYTKPAGASVIVMEVYGAGGGGEGGSNSPSPVGPGGQGGGGGGYFTRTFSAPEVGSTETVTIGAGGSAGSAGPEPANKDGGAGGDTSVGDLIQAFGGYGGGDDPSNDTNNGFGGRAWSAVVAPGPSQQGFPAISVDDARKGAIQWGYGTSPAEYFAVNNPVIGGPLQGSFANQGPSVNINNRWPFGIYGGGPGGSRRYSGSPSIDCHGRSSVFGGGGGGAGGAGDGPGPIGSMTGGFGGGDQSLAYGGGAGGAYPTSSPTRNGSAGSRIRLGGGGGGGKTDSGPGSYPSGTGGAGGIAGGGGGGGGAYSSGASNGGAGGAGFVRILTF